MMLPAATSAFGIADAIGIGGSLLSGLGGFGKKGPSNMDRFNAGREQNQLQLQLAKTYPKAAAEGWKAAGIHPLAGLGINMPSAGGSGYIGGGSDTASAMAEMGQGISRAAAVYSSREEREMSKVSARLQIENQELQNQRLRSEIMLMGSQQNPSLPDPRYPNQEDLPIGWGDAAPFLKIGLDNKNRPIRVYNDDLGDNEALQFLTAMRYSVPDYLHHNITVPAGKKLSDFYKKIRKSPSLFNSRKKGGY